MTVVAALFIPFLGGCSHEEGHNPDGKIDFINFNTNDIAISLGLYLWKYKLQVPEGQKLVCEVEVWRKGKKAEKLTSVTLSKVVSKEIEICIGVNCSGETLRAAEKATVVVRAGEISAGGVAEDRRSVSNPFKGYAGTGFYRGSGKIGEPMLLIGASGDGVFRSPLPENDVNLVLTVRME